MEGETNTWTNHHTYADLQSKHHRAEIELLLVSSGTPWESLGLSVGTLTCLGHRFMDAL